MENQKHADALILKHKKLEQLINDEMNHPRPDDMLLQKMKIERLRLEEEINLNEKL